MGCHFAARIVVISFWMVRSYTTFTRTHGAFKAAITRDVQRAERLVDGLRKQGAQVGLDVTIVLPSLPNAPSATHLA